MTRVVVLNPEASTARHGLAAVRGALADSELLAGAEVVPSRGWEHGRRIAAAAARRGCDLVVAAGGDGTVNSVLNGLMAVEGRRPVLAVLPLGTGNDLARSLGIPADLSSGLEELEKRSVRPIDVVRVTLDEVRYGANVSAGGFSRRAGEALNGQIKEAWGPLSYLRAALTNLPELASYEVVLEARGVEGFDPEDGDDARESGEDGSFRLERTLVNLVVANARYAAAGIPVAPEAVVDDGLLDVMAISAAELPRIGMVAALTAAGRHLGHELVTGLRARSLRVRARPEMGWNVDGEPLGSGPACFEVLPRALDVLVGSEWIGTLPTG